MSNYLKYSFINGAKDNKWECLVLIVKLRSGHGFVLCCKISYMDYEVLGFTLVNGYRIKLDLNETTEMGSSIYSSEWSGTYLIQGLLILLNIVNIIFWFVHLSITLIKWNFVLIRVVNSSTLMSISASSYVTSLQNENWIRIRCKLTFLWISGRGYLTLIQWWTCACL